MQHELTPETIFAVLEHKHKRQQEIQEALDRCRPRAYASVYGGRLDSTQLYIMAEFRPDIRDDRRPKWSVTHKGTDYGALCDMVLADIEAYASDMFGTEVERMALAIIRIKHAEGIVTDRALRMDRFTQEEIAAIHERASLLANEMSDGKPFEVEFVGASNEEAAA